MAEFCPGGSLQDYIKQLGATHKSVGPRRGHAVHGAIENRLKSHYSGNHCDKEAIEVQIKASFTPKEEQRLQAARGEAERKRRGGGEINGENKVQEGHVKSVGRALSLVATVPVGRLEVWFRQVQHS